MGIAVVSVSDRAKPFLASSVPDLQFHFRVIHRHDFVLKLITFVLHVRYGVSKKLFGHVLRWNTASQYSGRKLHLFLAKPEIRAEPSSEKLGV